MKKIFLVAFFVLVFFVSCSNKGSDVYGGFEDEDGEYSEVTDSDRGGYERPDDAPMPGGAGDNGNGTPGGSTGSKDDDSEASDDDETFDDEDETNDSDSTKPENPDENGDSDNGHGETPDEEEDLYYLEPDIEACTSGIPSDSEKQKVLARLNYLRAIHGLPAVVYSTEGDEITAECALIIAANNTDGNNLQLSHTPPQSWDCWSQQAYDGCNSSNIHVGWAKGSDLSQEESSEIVDSFMRDKGVDSIGHRRWLLDPWLGHISFGRADYTDGNGTFVLGAAIKVIHDDTPDVANLLDIDFVAYPFEEYPKELYPNNQIRMSFSVLKDKMNKFGNASSINLAGTTIAIIDSTNNKTISVSDLMMDTEGMGIPNNISWLASGIEYNKKYNVTVSNIMVDNVSRLYQYWFELK